MTRLESWKMRKRYLLTFLSGNDQKQMKYISKIQTEESKKEYDGKPNFTSFDIIGSCKELIFDIKKKKPMFHAINYSFDTDKACIKIEPTFEISESSDLKEELDDFVASTLALAKSQEIPVYPNSDELAEELAGYYRKMLLEGFTAPDGKGSRVRLMLTNSPKKKILEPEYYKSIKLTDFICPADIGIIKANIESELDKLQYTSNLLMSLKSSIMELEILLISSKRNENKLQKCLTNNPILFGVDYIRIIPKHRLGAEYEMDYALERQSGIIDLVEIESSNLPLFNGKSDPSQYLVHAEQQVLDWISWIEKNNAYARESLPGVMSPLGYIIIGRSSNIKDDAMLKLKRRNIIFKGQLIILTYDDLLNRAKSLLAKLQGL